MFFILFFQKPLENNLLLSQNQLLMFKALSCIGVIFLLLSFTACSTDNDDNIHDNDALTGVWRLSRKTIETPIDLYNNGDLSNVVYVSGSNLSYYSEIIISDNNSGVIHFSDNVSYNTREENGELIFMIASSTNSERVDIPLNYNLNGNSGNISYDDVEATFLLEGNTLFMTIEDGFVAKDIDTFETTIVQDMTYVFERQ